jgi:hypothetical protein
MNPSKTSTNGKIVSKFKLCVEWLNKKKKMEEITLKNKNTSKKPSERYSFKFTILGK